MELGDARWVEVASLRPGATDLEASDVLAFPVLAGDRTVGVALVGDVSWAWPWARPGHAWARGTDAAAAHEAGEAAVWFSDDTSWLSSFPTVDDDRGALGWEDADGWHVVVHAWGLGESRRRASALVGAADRWFADLGIPVDGMFARDDLRGGRRRELLAFEVGRAIDGRELVGWALDPTGAVDSRYEEVVFADDGFVTGLGRAPAEQTRVESGIANVIVTDGGASHDVAVQARIRVRAPVGTRVVPLCAPATPVTELSGLRPTPPARSTLAFGWREQPLVDLGPAWGFRSEACADARDWLAPTALSPASSLAVDVRWTERWASSHPLEAAEYYAWALRHFGDCEVRECRELASRMTAGTLELGHASVDHAVLPIQPFQSGAFPAEIRVGTALAPRWRAVLGGAWPEERTLGDGRWWIAAGVRSDTRVGFGAWAHEAEEPLLGFPAVALETLGGALQVDPIQVRAILNFYQDALPDWPLYAFTVVEGPSVPTAALHGEPRAPRGASSRGQWSVQPLSVLAPDGSSVGDADGALELSLAEALVAGWWDELPWHREDRWLRDAIVGYYVGRYADARNLPFTRTREVAVLDALAERAGREALLIGLETFLRGGDPGLDRFVATLAEACGPVAEDFVEAWLVARLRPRVEATWSVERGRTTIALSATPALGRYEIPVAVHQGRAAPRTVWIPVVDGRGEVAFDRAADAITVDPGGRLLSR